MSDFEPSESDDYLAISALQHYAYCPRQFALIHLEQVWEENRFTAEGRLLHERVDRAPPETRRAVRYERAVSLVSHQLRLIGKTDLLEIETQAGVQKYLPVEYKRGRPKVENWDRIQLCAQALCIEEMQSTTVTEGAIWYWQVRRRLPVIIDGSLRAETAMAIEAARTILSSRQTPAPVNDRRCKACSLIELCRPAAFRRDWSGAYLEQIYTEVAVDSQGTIREETT